MDPLSFNAGDDDGAPAVRPPTGAAPAPAAAGRDIPMDEVTIDLGSPTSSLAPPTHTTIYPSIPSLTDPFMQRHQPPASANPNVSYTTMLSGPDAPTSTSSSSYYPHAPSLPNGTTTTAVTPPPAHQPLYQPPPPQQQPSQQQQQSPLHFGDVASGHGGSGVGTGPDVTAVFGDHPNPPHPQQHQQQQNHNQQGQGGPYASHNSNNEGASSSSASWHQAGQLGSRHLHPPPPPAQQQQQQQQYPPYPSQQQGQQSYESLQRYPPVGSSGGGTSAVGGGVGGEYYEGGGGGGGAAAAAMGMAVPQPQFMRGARSLVVVVGDGVRINAAGPSLPGVDGSHFEFPITTRTTLPSWPAQEVKVQRRFRDVVALADLLTCTLPGRFLPQRPHRNAIQTRRATARFMEQRRSALERYLSRLANHPAVLVSAPFTVFLQAPGELRLSPAWAALQPPAPAGFINSTTRLFKQMLGSSSTTPTAREVTRSARSTGDMLRLVREQVASMQGAVQGAAVTPLESELRDAATRLEEFKRALGTLSTAAVALVERGQGVARAYQGFGHALTQLAKYEEKYGYATGQCELRAAEGLARVAEVSALCGDHLAQQLLVVHEQLEGLPVAQHALAVRERALLTSVTLEADLKRKQHALETAQSQGPAGFAKAQAFTSQVAEVKVSLAAARDEYQRLCEHNSEELVAWKAGMQRELCSAVGDVGAVQVVQCQRVHQLWSEAAVGLQQLRTSAPYTSYG